MTAGTELRRASLLALILIALALVGLTVSGCVFGSESERDLSEYFPQAEEEVTQQAAAQTAAQQQQQTAATTLPPLERLEDTSRAPASALEAVQRFFHLLATDRLAEAWTTISVEGKERYDAERFAQRYRDIWAEATIRGFSWEIVEGDDVNAPAFDVILRYQTTFFGEIEERVFAPVLRQPHWVVDWSPNLIFDGLGPEGFLIHTLVEVPERGRILDRNGEVLAGEAEVAVVGVYWDAVSDEDFLINFFVERLGMEEAVVRAQIYQDIPSYQFLPVAELPIDTPPELIEEYEQLSGQGILVRRETRRWYPHGELASHVVGYLQEINAEELEQRFTEGYRAGDRIGRDGIEHSFENALAGRRGGSLVILDASGRPIREITVRPAVPGSDVRLTLDLRVQQLAEAALGEQPGAAVALDPRNGQIIAMASFPRIDPNAITDGFTQAEVDLYFNDERQPFINRAVEQVYAPGSTFKSITLAAALEAGGYEVSDRLDCPVSWMGVGDQPLRNWKDTDQGLISLARALAESCNTVFYEIGLQLDRRDDRLLPSIAAGFGFGAPTGVVGLAEESGVNPSPAWKRAALNEPWYTGDTLNTSIGQGFVAVTPLQMANAYAALATSGVLFTPVIVHSIEPRGAPPEPIERRAINVLPVSAETLSQLKAALRGVVSQPFGTGWGPFNGSALRVAGKSGTAEDQVIDAETIATVDEAQQAVQQQAQQQAGQQSEQEQPPEQVGPFFTHAWFAAWANYDDPRLVVAIVLDDGKSGADDAGPIARRVLEGAILTGAVP